MRSSIVKIGLVVAACAGLVVLVVTIGKPLNAKDGDAAKGKDVFEQCSVCHNADSEEAKIGPGLKGLFKHAKLANGKEVTEPNVRDIITNGGASMPGFGDQISADDKDNLIAYLKTL